ncbi:MFS transporter [Trinickia caryophylli]|uniref:MFS transporter, putative metabolite:H+ symporter n=1 Tax=Trinickia caryophylli TaxID=28094 RepID=A0A1X7CEF7_TRICW|nr:MFS transporter [Trinickia caryophylli]PMS12592.1 MFS transporter [Trinickia caryophylli]WQE12873.1 MFS transporter [Trinickia caryophylli]GLU30595.1 MFS transporter [Trinickia caryophylli]SME95283.1 MFS transporter, putative metabolite:H+ symporter [Trinickia caryophylli]
MNRNRSDRRAAPGTTAFGHPTAFWFGVVAVIAGVLAHLPMYLMGRDMGYRLADMPMDATMLSGMAAIVVGLGASLYGLVPRRADRAARAASTIRVSALDDASLAPAHYRLLLAMALAVTIDVMKPTALAFVMPGMAAEYGLESPLDPVGTTPVVWIALVAITGTVCGSFLWGWLGDRIGRRASILYAGIGFMGTSICGAMPSFGWNLAMCFIMGMAVGGMLPICYALLAETIPARHRGWLMILIGGDIAGAYVLTSWLSAELVPIFSWRILWLIGLPTGALFIVLNRWIPESPRFLLAQGREDEARAVMARYGAALVEGEAPQRRPGAQDASAWGALLGARLRASTLAVGCLAVSSGIVLFGFNLWIPTNLRMLGFTQADAILRNASLMGFPLTFVVAWLYGFWSSKKTIALLTLLTALALFGFAFAGNEVVHHRVVLYVLLIVPIWGISSVVAVLSVYSAEIYPTAIRSRATGFAAGASKAGGVAIIASTVVGLATPSIATISMVGAIAMTLSAVLTLVCGVETRRRRLEDIDRSGESRIAV